MEENAYYSWYTSTGQLRTITSREILESADHSDLTDAQYQALDILIYYSDAFYSFPGYDGDFTILRYLLQNALNDLADSLSAIDSTEFFAQIDTNLNGVITWEEMIPWVQ